VPALATGLAQGAWMLRQLAAPVQGLAVTTHSEAWQPEGAQLLLGEAFITATGKPEPLTASQHLADATAAGLALLEMLDSPATLTSSVCCSPREPVNLLVAMALWARLRIAPAELQAEVLVVASHPQHQP
jgi:hypothetical protein